MPALSQFAAAIANAEGFNSPGSRPQRNNNPGDLRNWPGVPADSAGYSIFPNPQAGWNALEQDLATIAAGQSQYISPEMTIAQMGAVWAGGDPNWASNVAAYLGVSSAAMIGQFLPGNAPAPAPGPGVQAANPLPALSVSAPMSGEDFATLGLLAAGAFALLMIGREIFA